jgi:hypothetical protein
VDPACQSRTHFDATNTPKMAQLGGYTVVNATFIAAPAGGPWRVTVGVNNATDNSGSGCAEIAYARPRENFGTLAYEF